MAKARIGHFAEAQILQALEVDYIDESEVLTPADEAHHIDKWAFSIPFVCGATNLGEALRRISEGAAMIRSKGEAGTGNVVEAVRHLRQILGDIKKITTADSAELYGGRRTCRRRSSSSRRSPRPGSCRSRCFVPAASRRRPMRRSSCSSAPRPSSSDRASSRARTRRFGPGRSSRRRRTSTTQRSWRRSRAGLGEPMVGAEISTLDVKLAERGW